MGWIIGLGIVYFVIFSLCKVASDADDLAEEMAHQAREEKRNG